MLHDTEGSSQMLATTIPWPIMSAVSHAWKLLKFNGCILVGICELTTNDDICVLDSTFQAVSAVVFSLGSVLCLPRTPYDASDHVATSLHVILD